MPARKSSKLVHGVGIKGNISVKVDGVFKKAYLAWKSMLGRCYYYGVNGAQPTYNDCFVCDEWLNFEIFEAWFLVNYIEGFDLDKDLLSLGNKIYGPDYCRFVPSEVNRLFVNVDSGHLPGVTKQVKSKTFICRISKSCKRIYLGSFKTEIEAFNKYKQEKEKHVKEIAKKYYDSGDITKQIFNSLLNWRLV